MFEIVCNLLASVVLFGLAYYSFRKMEHRDMSIINFVAASFNLIIAIEQKRYYRYIEWIILYPYLLTLNIFKVKRRKKYINYFMAILLTNLQLFQDIEYLNLVNIFDKKDTKILILQNVLGFANDLYVYLNIHYPYNYLIILVYKLYAILSLQFLPIYITFGLYAILDIIIKSIYTYLCWLKRNKQVPF
jgi:hypothetical protein